MWKNKEAKKAYDRKYYLKHRAKILVNKRAYHSTNKELVSAKRRTYRIENSGKVREQRRKYYQLNRALYSKSYQEWRKKAKRNGKYRHLQRRWLLWKKYRLTVADFDYMLRKQGGYCAICQDVNYQRSLHVDHDHKTGKVRGLLCHRCNVGIALFKENPIFMRKAIRYITKHKEVLSTP